MAYAARPRNDMTNRSEREFHDRCIARLAFISARSLLAHDNLEMVALAVDVNVCEWLLHYLSTMTAFSFRYLVRVVYHPQVHLQRQGLTLTVTHCEPKSRQKRRHMVRRLAINMNKCLRVIMGYLRNTYYSHFVL